MCTLQSEFPNVTTEIYRIEKNPIMCQFLENWVNGPCRELISGFKAETTIAGRKFQHQIRLMGHRRTSRCRETFVSKSVELHFFRTLPRLTRLSEKVCASYLYRLFVRPWTSVNQLAFFFQTRSGVRSAQRTATKEDLLYWRTEWKEWQGQRRIE